MPRKLISTIVKLAVVGGFLGSLSLFATANRAYAGGGDVGATVTTFDCQQGQWQGVCNLNGNGRGSRTHSPKGTGHRPQVTTSYPARF